MATLTELQAQRGEIKKITDKKEAREKKIEIYRTETDEKDCFYNFKRLTGEQLSDRNSDFIKKQGFRWTSWTFAWFRQRTSAWKKIKKWEKGRMIMYPKMQKVKKDWKEKDNISWFWFAYIFEKSQTEEIKKKGDK